MVLEMSARHIWIFLVGDLMTMHHLLSYVSLMELMSRWDKVFAIGYLTFTLILGMPSDKSQAFNHLERVLNTRVTAAVNQEIRSLRLSYSDGQIFVNLFVPNCSISRRLSNMVISQLPKFSELCFDCSNVIGTCELSGEYKNVEYFMKLWDHIWVYGSYVDTNRKAEKMEDCRMLNLQGRICSWAENYKGMSCCQSRRFREGFFFGHSRLPLSFYQQSPHPPHFMYPLK